MTLTTSYSAIYAPAYGPTGKKHRHEGTHAIVIAPNIEEEPMSQEPKWIPGFVLIYHNHLVSDEGPVKATHPWRLYVNLRPPEFMEIAFICLYGGSEEVVGRGVTRKVLEKFLDEHDIRTHPRLRYYRITDPEGREERFEKQRRA